MRSSIGSALTTFALAGSLTACSSATPPSQASPSSPASGPSPTWLAIVSSAADPNELDARRSDVVAALGGDDVQHVLLSPGACFTGIPRRFGPLYVLAVTGETRSEVVDRSQRVGTEPGWVGSVTSTCLD